MLQRPHVVQTVRQLYEQDADIARDGEQQLPEILGLFGLFRHQIEFLDLGEPVDQRADLRAEQRIDLRAGGLGVLDRVVKQGRGDSRVVQAHLRQDRGHF